MTEILIDATLAKMIYSVRGTKSLTNPCFYGVIITPEKRLVGSDGKRLVAVDRATSGALGWSIPDGHPEPAPGVYHYVAAPVKIGTVSKLLLAPVDLQAPDVDQLYTRATSGAPVFSIYAGAPRGPRTWLFTALYCLFRDEQMAINPDLIPDGWPSDEYRVFASISSSVAFRAACFSIIVCPYKWEEPKKTV